MKPWLYHYTGSEYEIYIYCLYHTLAYGSKHVSMRLYKQIKITIDRSTYLDILETPTYIKGISQLRLSSHKLAIETCRHNKISLHDRKCTHCTLNDIEDEFHFVLIIMPLLFKFQKLYTYQAI